MKHELHSAVNLDLVVYSPQGTPRNLAIAKIRWTDGRLFGGIVSQELAEDEQMCVAYLCQRAREAEARELAG